MQPPPRKGNYAKYLKTLHTEQLAKLQLKNQHECDLLEDIRQFTVKRSAIEKSYSEALLKISSAYLNKKMPNIPEIKLEGAEEKWNMWSVWQTVLEENEKLARARLAAIEVFQQQIADEAKVLREYKIQVSKKCIGQLGNVQKELQFTVADVDKTKKQYFDEEHSAHDVRDKARDIEEKLKRKKGSFFQSITSLQKNSARVTSRKEQLEERSTGARNDYLLGLASANAHQNRYFTVDLQTTMTSMENYVYERIADYLMLMGRTELLTCSATQHSFGKIRDQAQQLTREYNVQCCYLFYPVLKQHIQYEFENCENDPVTKITCEQGTNAESVLQEAKKMAQKQVRETQHIKDYARRLAICQAMRDAGQKVDPQDPNGFDLETKIENYRESIRKAETEKVKVEACIELLRQGGVPVDQWLEEAQQQDVQRSNSSLSLRTDGSGQDQHPSSDSFYDSDNEAQEPTQSKAAAASGGAFETMATSSGGGAAAGGASGAGISYSMDSDDESVCDTNDVDVVVEQERQKIEEITAGWDDPSQLDWGAATEPEAAANQAAETVSISANSTSSSVPVFKCTALYSYSAQNPDELTIVENEQLEVVGEGDGDGWLRARNYRGEEGYVPHNYLDVERDAPAESGHGQQLQSQISFSSVDYTVDSEEQDAYQDTQSVQSPDQVSVISAPVKPKASAGMFCIALYDYDATADDELTFEEGQIIRILKKEAHGDDDDGWWEGELEGKVGNFPSIVVDECDENGEPLTGNEDYEEDDVTPGLVTPPETVLKFAPAPIFEDPTSGAVDPVQLEQQLKKSQQKPPVLVLEPESDTPVAERPTNMGQEEFGLNVVSVTITAATPMCEHAETGFPEPPSAEAATASETESQGGEASGDDQEEAAQAESPTSSRSSNESPPISSPPAMPPPPAPPTVIRPKPKGANVVAVVEEEQRVSDEGVADPNAFEANFEDNFDADFDAAFDDASPPPPPPPPEDNTPKQVVGGRASIPEELDSHQLERLQNLKESNA